MVMVTFRRAAGAAAVLLAASTAHAFPTRCTPRPASLSRLSASSFRMAATHDERGEPAAQGLPLSLRTADDSTLDSRPLFVPNVHGAGKGQVLHLPPRTTRRAVTNWPGDVFDRLVLPDRSVRIWLPPGYDSRDTTTRYPTLYVHDGQVGWELLAESSAPTLPAAAAAAATAPPLSPPPPPPRSPPPTTTTKNMMDMELSWTNRCWDLGSTLTRLLDAGDIEVAPIVIMVDNCVENWMTANPLVRRRWLEYSDTPIGDRYLEYLVDELKPLVDQNFHTNPAPEYTSSMGSSMGGLSSFLAVLRRPEVFRNCVCMSPAFQAPLIAEVAVSGWRVLKGISDGDESSARPPARIYIDNGGDTDDFKVPLIDLFDGMNPGYFWLDTSLQAGIDAMLGALKLHGIPFHFVRAPGARHNERAWGKRVDRPLRFLYSRSR